MTRLFFLLLSFILLEIVWLSLASTRIVGGNNAIPLQFPHQVSFRRHNNHGCGGSIISKRYVLTAAQCVPEALNPTFSPTNFSVRVGTTNRIAGGIIVPIKRIKIHPGLFLNNDLALLELKEDLIFSDSIKAIEMFDGIVPPNSEVIVSGWGRTEDNGVGIPIYLQYNKLTSLSKAGCYMSTKIYTDALICLNHQEGNGICHGDAGGPATYNGKLIGVASFITEKCGASSADAFVNVSHNLNWILTNIN